GPARHDRLTAASAADVVVVAAGEDPGDDVAAHDRGDAGTVRAGGAGLEAAADDRQRDLRATGVLVVDFVGVELGLRIEPLGPGRNAGAGLQRVDVHADDHPAALLGDVMTRRAGADQKQDKRGQQNRWPEHEDFLPPLALPPLALPTSLPAYAWVTQGPDKRLPTGQAIPRSIQCDEKIQSLTVRRHDTADAEPGRAQDFRAAAVLRAHGLV